MSLQELQTAANKLKQQLYVERSKREKDRARLNAAWKKFKDTLIELEVYDINKPLQVNKNFTYEYKHSGLTGSREEFLIQIRAISSAYPDNDALVPIKFKLRQTTFNEVDIIEGIEKTEFLIEALENIVKDEA